MNQTHQTESIIYNFGHFEGFNFRSQSAIDRLLTAQEVVDWDHDRQGEAEFWPTGDEPRVSLVFEHRSTVTGSELLSLARLLEQMGGDTTDNFLAVYHAATVSGNGLPDLSADGVQDRAPFCFRGSNFTDVLRDAAFELFELFYPELYRLWESTPCDGLIFDTDRFLDSPSFSVSEVRIGDEVAVLVAAE